MPPSRPTAPSARLTISELPAGTHGRITAILGGWRLRQSLNQVGIHTGDFFHIVHAGHLGGPVLIHIHSTDVALGNGMAAAIVVDLENEGCDG